MDDKADSKVLAIRNEDNLEVFFILHNSNCRIEANIAKKATVSINLLDRSNRKPYT